PKTVTEHLDLPYHNKVWRRRRFQPSGFFASHVDFQVPILQSLFTGEDDTWSLGLKQLCVLS
ncbi:unnamed protein product, partial [Brassica napus]